MTILIIPVRVYWENCRMVLCCCSKFNALYFFNKINKIFSKIYVHECRIVYLYCSCTFVIVLNLYTFSTRMIYKSQWFKIFLHAIQSTTNCFRLYFIHPSLDLIETNKFVPVELAFFSPDAKSMSLSPLDKQGTTFSKDSFSNFEN